MNPGFYYYYIILDLTIDAWKLLKQKIARVCLYLIVAHMNYMSNRWCFLKNSVLYLVKILKYLCNRMKFSLT